MNCFQISTHFSNGTLISYRFTKHVIHCFLHSGSGQKILRLDKAAENYGTGLDYSNVQDEILFLTLSWPRLTKKEDVSSERQPIHEAWVSGTSSLHLNTLLSILPVLSQYLSCD